MLHRIQACLSFKGSAYRLNSDLLATIFLHRSCVLNRMGRWYHVTNTIPWQ